MTKKWAETWDLTEIPSSYDAIEIIITDDRIALTWDYDGEKYHAVLNSVDGIKYNGTYKCENVIERQIRHVELSRLEIQGDVFLIGYYHKDRASGPIVLRVNEGAYPF